MTWTYSGDPKANTSDLLRFLCGDTDALAPLISDEELQYLLIAKGNANAAAPHACAAIMAKLAREVDYWLGPEKVFASQRFAAYKELMQTLRELWIGVNAAPSWQDPVSTGESAPIFDVGMHDNFNGGGKDGLSS